MTTILFRNDPLCPHVPRCRGRSLYRLILYIKGLSSCWRGIISLDRYSQCAKTLPETESLGIHAVPISSVPRCGRFIIVNLKFALLKVEIAVASYFCSLPAETDRSRRRRNPRYDGSSTCVSVCVMNGACLSFP